jgi:hypothetical protein
LKIAVPEGGGAVVSTNGFRNDPISPVVRVALFFLLLPFQWVPVVSLAVSLLFGCVQKLADCISETTR